METYICKDCGYQKLLAEEEPIPRACPECGCTRCTVVYGKVRPRSNVFVTYEDSPRWSEAMGVAPQQVEEAKRLFPDSVYDPDGRLLIRNRGHKKKEMRRRGYFD